MLACFTWWRVTMLALVCMLIRYLVAAVVKTPAGGVPQLAWGCLGDC
jgi:hypothetical protein